MTKLKLLQILARGEDSRHQFKRDETNADRHRGGTGCGLGSGIPRALDEWPGIRFKDEVAGNQFKAVMARPEPLVQIVAPVGIGQAETSVPPQVTPQVGALLARFDLSLNPTLLRCSSQQAKSRDRKCGRLFAVCVWRN